MLIPSFGFTCPVPFNTLCLMYKPAWHLDLFRNPGLPYNKAIRRRHWNNTLNNFWNLQPIDSTKQYVEHTLNIWRDFSVPFEIYISSALPSTPWNKWTSLACWVIVKDLPSCALQKSTFNINRLGILRHALHVISHESQNLEDRNKVEPLSHLFHPTSPTKIILNTWGHISAWVMSQIPHSSIYWYFPALQSNMFNIWRKLACGVIIANLPRFDLTRQNASFIICEKFPRGVILLIYPPLYLQNRTFYKTPGSTYEPARHPESCLKCLFFPYSNTLNKWTELAPRAMFGIYAHCTHHTQQYIRQMD